ncbi:MAG: DUF4129 domain-containing protein [Halorientalis sp.]
MDRERMLSICIAALCMVAIGVSGTTLDSTVSQTPDDVINLNNRRLPFGGDSTRDVDQQIQRNKRSQGHSDSEARLKADSGDSHTKQAGPGAEQGQSDGESGPSQVAKEPAPSDGRSAGMGPMSESLLQRLLDWLSRLLPFLVALVALALAVRYRERLLALALAPLALLPTTNRASEAGGDRDPWANVTPSDDIDRAWYGMVRQLDVDRPWAKTPDECRSAAVEAGLDPDAVSTLTRLFREKRYGNGPTERARERARQCRERLDLGGSRR